MRIFIGLTDVANITANYAKGFKALGHEVFSVVWNKSYFFPEAEYDLVIDQRKPGETGKTPFYYLKIVGRLARLVEGLKCDVFILYAPAVLPTYIYYPILKFLGKKIVSAFWGSDIRYWLAFAEEMKEMGFENEMSAFITYARERSGGSYWDKLRTIRTAEKYSDLILSQPDCGQLQTRPYMRTHLPLNLGDYIFNIPSRARPLILHAPSVPEAKGTDLVLQAIKELEEEGLSFEFRLIEKMPNHELRKLLSESDIVVDELYSATVGGLSAEAMASGNAVLVRYMAEYSKVPTGCPAVNTNIFTLKENLRRLITNSEERRDLAIRGKSFVEANNENVNICRGILTCLGRKKTIDYDFYPVFYKSFIVPERILKEEKRSGIARRFEFFSALLSTGTTRIKKG